ncbi:hypothetical protein [Thauera chlorobenzoica]|uniref:Uncharacterized protein n=1 Tax=Thauera chlorobenzoica TaxID=96773 RepID=A0A1H5X9I4_9RHOO|nr:hypothetical protein [Thauera chlorobenzoica]APR04776.1 hypothetical protein Tchl_1929 [Thauera chlorobenzoica]SEG07896.1 hypothetical protein SAMN05216242_1164 [Thauera chlorobenzoica]
MAPKTNAERQRDYRARQKAEGEGAHRLNTWLASGAHLALSRLAAHRGMTRRETLERLILAADRQAAAGLSDEAFEAYRLGGDGEAQP